MRLLVLGLERTLWRYELILFSSSKQGSWAEWRWVKRAAEGQRRDVELPAPCSSCKALLLLSGCAPGTSRVPGLHPPDPSASPTADRQEHGVVGFFSSNYPSSGTTDSVRLLLRKMRYSSGYFRRKKSKLRSLQDFCSCHGVCLFFVSCKIAQTDTQKDSFSIVHSQAQNQYLNNKEEQCNNLYHNLVFPFWGGIYVKRHLNSSTRLF